MCSSIKYVERIPVVLSQCGQTGNSRSTFLPYDAALKNCSYINCKCPVQIPTLGVLVAEGGTVLERQTVLCHIEAKVRGIVPKAAWR
jgi:hypothetical protein